PAGAVVLRRAPRSAVAVGDPAAVAAPAGPRAAGRRGGGAGHRRAGADAPGPRDERGDDGARRRRDRLRGRDGRGDGRAGAHVAGVRGVPRLSRPRADPPGAGRLLRRAGAAHPGPAARPHAVAGHVRVHRSRWVPPPGPRRERPRRWSPAVGRRTRPARWVGGIAPPAVAWRGSRDEKEVQPWLSWPVRRSRSWPPTGTRTPSSPSRGRR